MRRMLKSINLVEFEKIYINLKIKNILKVALISGHTVDLWRRREKKWEKVEVESIK